MNLIRAFRARRPFCAAIIGLLFGPAMVMGYLGKGWLAVIYFIAAIIAGIGGFWLLSLLGVPFAYYGALITVTLNLIGATHGYLAARRLDGGKRFPWYSHWYSLPIVFIALPFVLATLTRGLLFQPFTIPAISMAPTLQAGDYVFASKYAYGYGRYSFPWGFGPVQRILARSPERGDVIVFRLPNDQADYVKRVIGLPGDHVQLKSGIVYLNGQPLPRQPAGTYTMQGSPASLFSETLPSGRAYIVAEILENSRGDNTAEFVVPAAHYFVLGDNRDNSLDSRFNMGFIPDENVFAEAALVFFNEKQAERNWIWVK